MFFPLPSLEAERLRALERFDIAGTAPEVAFDRITSLAARLFQVPMALVSLVESERQWLKSSCGLDVCETRRDVAFCAHAILHDEVMVVPDARLDPRFAANPLVTAAPHIRFYAGAPLHTRDGFNIGTLCVLDTQPRDFSDAERATLADLAAVVMDEMELRLAHRRLGDESARREAQIVRESQEMLRLVLDTIPQFVFWKDRDFRYLGCNRLFAEAAGLSDPEAIRGKTDYDLPWKREESDVFRECDQRVVESGQAEFHIVEPIRRADGRAAWIDTSKVPLHDARGEVMGILGTFEDISERIEMQQALEKAQQNLRELFDNAIEGIFQSTPDGRYLTVNPALARLLGYESPEELLGNANFLEEQLYVNVTARSEFKRLVERDGRVTGFEAPVRRKDGRIIWTSENARAIRDETGRVLYYEGFVEDITERKKVEITLRQAREELEARVEARTEELLCVNAELEHLNAELRDREEQLQLAQRVSRMGSWQAWLGTGRLTLSPQLDEIHGFAPGTTITTFAELLELVHPDDQASISEGTKRAVESGEEFVSEFRIFRPDGEVRWLESRGRPFYDETGAPQRAVGVSIDVTRRKLAEAALRESQERFENAFELSAIGMALVAPDGRWLRVNKKLSQILGYSPDELFATDFQSITHPDDLDADLDLVRRLLSGEVTQYQLEKRYFHRDGHVVWALLDVSLVRDEAGEPVHLISQVQDVSARRHNEERLRLLESVAVNAKDVILITEAEPVDEPGPRILYANEAFERMTGYSVEEVIGQTPRILQGPDTSPESRKRIRTALKEWNPVVEEMLNYRKDGTPFWVELSIVPVADERGWFTHWVSIQRDITERKHTEAALRKANVEAEQAREAAERANLAKSEFLSRMSHELRTPLNAILGFSQILQMDALAPEQAAMVGDIGDAGNHLLDLINEVLDIARIEQNRIALAIEAVPVGVVVAESLALVMPLAASRGIRVCNELKTDAADAPHVLADARRLGQVLLNLFSNAIKYDRECGELSVRCRNVLQGRVRVEVSDSGHGIAPDKMERLFMSFERLGAENTAVEGTGLGLALSKRLVEAMGGRIGVESVVEQGCTFWVELPSAPAPSRDSRSNVAHALIPMIFENGPSSAKQNTLLYIEDNAANFKVVESVLARHSDVRLLGATEGENGVALALEWQPDLVLLDLHLPDLSGVEVLRRLRSHPLTRQTPVVVLSADATPGQVERLQSAGAADYLTKPLQVPLLLRTLERFMENNASLVENAEKNGEYKSERNGEAVA